MIAGVFWTGHFLYSIKWNVLCVKRCVKRGRTLVSPLHVTRLSSVAQPRRISRKKTDAFISWCRNWSSYHLQPSARIFRMMTSYRRAANTSQSRSLSYTLVFLYVNFTWQESLNSSSPSQTSLVCEIGFYVLFLWVYKVVRRSTVICRV